MRDYTLGMSLTYIKAKSEDSFNRIKKSMLPKLSGRINGIDLSSSGMTDYKLNYRLKTMYKVVWLLHIYVLQKALTSISIASDEEYCYQQGDNGNSYNRNEDVKKLEVAFGGSCGGGDRDGGRSEKDRVALRTVSDGIGCHHRDFILFSWFEAKLLQ